MAHRLSELVAAERGQVHVFGSKLRARTTPFSRKMDQSPGGLEESAPTVLAVQASRLLFRGQAGRLHHNS
jgi:hypothetical protein